MKKLTNVLFITLLATITSLILVSCGDDDNSKPAPSPKPDLEVKEGRLVFKDTSVFNNTLNELAEMDDEALDAWEERIGHLSMRRAIDNLFDLEDENLIQSKLSQYSNILIDEDDGDYELIVEDDLLATIISADGKIEIGENLYQVASDKVIWTNKLGITKAIPIQGFSKNLKLSGTNRCSEKYRSKRKLKGKVWVRDWWFYKSAGVATKAKKKGWLFWRRHRVEEIGAHINIDQLLFEDCIRLNARKAKCFDYQIGYGVSHEKIISYDYLKNEAKGFAATHYLKNGSDEPFCSTLLGELPPAGPVY